MPTPTQTVVRKVMELLQGGQGLDYSIAMLIEEGAEEPAFMVEQVSVTQAASDVVEKAGKVVFPAFHVYVEKVQNRMTEKFRRFSGTVHVVTEVRLSQDRLEQLTERLQFYADAVTDALERHRGCLGEGMYLNGKYQVTFDAVKKGGLHFHQSARVSCEVDVNRS